MKTQLSPWMCECGEPNSGELARCNKCGFYRHPRSQLAKEELQQTSPSRWGIILPLIVLILGAIALFLFVLLPGGATSPL